MKSRHVDNSEGVVGKPQFGADFFTRVFVKEKIVGFKSVIDAF